MALTMGSEDEDGSRRFLVGSIGVVVVAVAVVAEVREVELSWSIRCS